MQPVRQQQSGTRKFNLNDQDYFQENGIPENSSKNSIFNWVLKLNLDHPTFVNTTKNLLWVFFNIYHFKYNITTCSRSLKTQILHLQGALLAIIPQFFQMQSFPYENHCKCYKKLASRLWPMLFTLTFFFLNIHSPLLLENKKLWWLLFSSAN